jgi:hypothetical protein
MSIGFATARDTQTPYLDYADVMKESQKAIADAFELWSSAFDGALANRAGRLALEPLPPKELVEAAFDVVERMIAAQKQLVLALFDTAP